MPEPLDHPPAVEEGDNAEAGGGKPPVPTTEDELADAPELDEDDFEDDGDEPEA